ncbi:MAG TPA: nicotinate-nucleotide adenylyltransferase [Acidobacteriota bacterium]|nr:nicotinate-nucleotide adenylyltransferase [Acidobacteriota bacterium]
MTERMGLFGGTFDPIHLGHLRAAREVLEKFALDRILFVPSFIPPHKERKGMAPARDRLRMVELACAGEPRFAASSIEVDAGGRSYSILTLERIRGLYAGARVFFILGADAFLEIGTWREHERVLDESLFIVMTRPGAHLEDAVEVVGEPLRSRVRAIAEGETVDEALLGGHRIFLLPIRALDVSSTEVRRRVRAGETVAGLVPEAVGDYIRTHGLYRELEA